MNIQEIQTAFTDRIERGIFQPIRHHVHDEDRLAEGLAMAWSTFADHGRKGRILDDAILVAHCRRRARDLGRRLVGGVRKHDVLDVRNQIEERVLIIELDEGLAHDHALNPTRKLNSAIDLNAWLHGLGEDECTLLAMRAAGENLIDAGRVLGRSAAWCCTKLRALGCDLAKRAGVTVDLAS